MARTAAGAALTAEHRRRQLALRALVIRDVTRLWELWTPGRVDTYPRFTEAATVLIDARYVQSAGIAAAYYRAFRAVEKVGGADTPRMPPKLTPEDVIPALRATGLAATMRAIRVGFSSQAASKVGLVAASGSAGRLALTGGRGAVIASTGGDRRASGWRRVTSGSACDFCVMLAGRGPVFKSDRTAGFEAHDHCACTAEPVFTPGT